MRLIYNDGNIATIPQHDLDLATIEALAQRDKLTVDEFINNMIKRGVFTLLDESDPIDIDPIEELDE